MLNAFKKIRKCRHGTRQPIKKKFQKLWVGRDMTLKRKKRVKNAAEMQQRAVQKQR